jgi:pimeloyl-ACP methyl ester carboxylesterase
MGEPEISDAQLDRGCVLILPGIEGNRWQLSGMQRGLRAAGIDQAIDIIPWGTPPLISSLPNLINIDKNRERAKKIAERIVTLRRDRPDAPITLIGFSGGGGLAVLTLEVLPDGVTVDRTILIAAAISSRYDVRRLLPRCGDGLVNIYSRLDPVVGAGTLLMGTIDRRHSVSAGHCGFVDHDDVILESPYLTQIGWTTAWLKHRHLGGHIGYLTTAWAREVLAPLIVTREKPTATRPSRDR